MALWDIEFPCIFRSLIWSMRISLRHARMPLWCPQEIKVVARSSYRLNCKMASAAIVVCGKWFSIVDSMHMKLNYDLMYEIGWVEVFLWKCSCRWEFFILKVLSVAFEKKRMQLWIKKRDDVLRCASWWYDNKVETVSVLKLHHYCSDRKVGI